MIIKENNESLKSNANPTPIDGSTPTTPATGTRTIPVDPTKHYVFTGIYWIWDNTWYCYYCTCLIENNEVIFITGNMQPSSILVSLSITDNVLSISGWNAGFSLTQVD